VEGVLKVADKDTFALQVGEDGGCGGGGDGGCGGTGGSRALGHLFRVSGALRRWVVVLCQHPVPSSQSTRSTTPAASAPSAPNSPLAF